MANAARKVVLGLGNLLNCDEGLGVQAVKRLDAQLGVQTDYELLDGGVLGLNLLMVVEECSHLLILDAVDAGKPAGTVVELARDEIPLYAGVKLSQHQVTFQEVLGLADMRGNLPPNLHLIGIQPADLSIGLELSPTVANALPEVIRRARVILCPGNIARRFITPQPIWDATPSSSFVRLRRMCASVSIKPPNRRLTWILPESIKSRYSGARWAAAQSTWTVSSYFSR